jgi:hypothetical protein
MFIQYFKKAVNKGTPLSIFKFTASTHLGLSNPTNASNTVPTIYQINWWIESHKKCHFERKGDAAYFGNGGGSRVRHFAADCALCMAASCSCVIARASLSNFEYVDIVEPMEWLLLVSPVPRLKAKASIHLENVPQKLRY